MNTSPGLNEGTREREGRKEGQRREGGERNVPPLTPSKEHSMFESSVLGDSVVMRVMYGRKGGVV